MTDNQSQAGQTLEGVLAASTDRMRPVPAGAAMRWAGKVPPLLLDIWRRYGLARLAGGRLRLVDPARYQPLMNYVFNGDPDLGGDTHAVALGDMGELVVWSERHGYGFLSPVLCSLELPYLLVTDPPPADTQIADHLVMMPAARIEAWDDQRKPLHDRLRARLGPLEHDMIYAATPAPPRPGGTPVEDYLVADALEWLEAIHTEMNVSIMDFRREPFQLRIVGQPWPPGMAAGRKKVPL